MTADANAKRRAARRRYAIAAGLAVLGLAAIAYPLIKQEMDRQAIAKFKKECRAAVIREDWSHLEETAQRWAAIHPDNDDARLYLAEAAVQRNDAAAAVAALEAVSPDYHGFAAAELTRADLLFSELNRPLEAVEIWTRLLESDDPPPSIYQPLIYFYAMTLQRERLRNVIRRAMAEKNEPPGAYVYLTSSDGMNFSDGLPKLQRWRQTAPDSEALAAAEAVYSARFTGTNELAASGTQTVAPGDRSALDTALDKYPHNLTLLAESTAIAVMDGNERKVFENLEAAGPAAEEDGRFWRFRGWLLNQRGNTEGAAEALRKAVELDPYDWRSRFQLAETYRVLGRKEEAAEMAATALRGKELEGDILTLPDSQSLTPPLVARIYEYVLSVGDAQAASALRNRI